MRFFTIYRGKMPCTPYVTWVEFCMDRQDAQNNTETQELLKGTNIGCAFDVLNELGSGFLESVYEKSLLSHSITA